MATKAELEEEVESLKRSNASLRGQITRLKEASAVVEKAPESPSPVDRGQMYVESHPILGVISKASVTEQSHGDGRIGDGATIVRERNG